MKVKDLIMKLGEFNPEAEIVDHNQDPMKIMGYSSNLETDNELDKQNITHIYLSNSKNFKCCECGQNK